MSEKFKRLEAPPAGQTLLLQYGKEWKDPTKPENAPLPLLESQKGIEIPSWTQIGLLTVTLSIFTAIQHRRGLRRGW